MILLNKFIYSYKYGIDMQWPEIIKHKNLDFMSLNGSDIRVELLKTKQVYNHFDYSGIRHRNITPVFIHYKSDIALYEDEIGIKKLGLGLKLKNIMNTEIYSKCKDVIVDYFRYWH